MPRWYPIRWLIRAPSPMLRSMWLARRRYAHNLLDNPSLAKPYPSRWLTPADCHLLRRLPSLLLSPVNKDSMPEVRIASADLLARGDQRHDPDKDEGHG